MAKNLQELKELSKKVLQESLNKDIASLYLQLEKHIKTGSRGNFIFATGNSELKGDKKYMETLANQIEGYDGFKGMKILEFSYILRVVDKAFEYKIDIPSSNWTE